MYIEKMPTIFIVLFLVTTVRSSSEKINNFVARRAFDYDLYESVLDPELCTIHLREMEAFEFYDASFRVPQGILRGNTFSLGGYDQCLAINQPLEEGSISGKYCLIETQSLQIPILSGDYWPANVTWLEMRSIWTDQNLETYKKEKRELATLTYDYETRTSVIDLINTVPFTLALCIPRACAVDDVLQPLLNNQFIEFNYTEQSCRLPDDKPYSGADVAFIVVFSVIGFLTLISTAYELNHIFIKKATTKPDELLSCFSVYGNTDRLLTLNSRPGALDCLEGIRALSILWVIFGHSFLVYFGEYMANILDFLSWASNLRSVILLGANVSVDSFFLLSGLLLVYTTATKMKQMELIKSVHLFYLQRLLRMFPLLAATVLLQASVLHQVTDGARWNRVAWETQKCRDYWWSALLHIQNLANPREICLSHAWYLSLDMQLHILSPLLLFWVLGSRRSAWTGLAAAILGSVSLLTVFCFIMEFQQFTDVRYQVYFYHNTLARSPVFIIGMLCGYVLHISRGKRIKMSSWFVLLGYAVAMVLAAYCMYQEHHDWESQVVINLNRALMRSGWAIALTWLIVACVHGYAGPINWLLSLKLFKFLARISYAMYLLHYPIQFVASGADSSPVYFSMESGFIYFASDVAYTVIVSTAACVLIDAPCSTLIRRLMKEIAPKGTRETTTKTTVQETTPVRSMSGETKDENEAKR